MNTPKHHEPQATFEDLLLSTILLKADVTAVVRLVEELAHSLGVTQIEGMDVVTRFQSNRLEAIDEALERARRSDPELAHRLRDYLSDL